MKRCLIIAAALLLVLPQTVSAINLYTNTLDNVGVRFNPGTGTGATAPDITFEDVPVPDARRAGATSVDVNRVRVGIRRLAGAIAMTVKLYVTDLVTAAPYLDVTTPRPTQIGLAAGYALAAQAATATVVVDTGVLGTATRVPLDTGFVAGYGTFAVGVEMSDTIVGAGNLQGWRVVAQNGPDFNNDLFWDYDTEVPNVGFFYFGGSPIAVFYLIVDGNLVTGACCAANLTCTQTTAGACTGAYLGDGVACTAGVCAAQTASCCLANGCAARTPAACTAAGGLPGNIGSSCTGVVCNAICAAAAANCQAPNAVTGLNSSNSNFVVADNFRTTTAASLTGLCYNALYVPAPATSDDFTVTYYTTDPVFGLPGTVIQSFSQSGGGLAVTKAGTGSNVVGFAEFKYHATHAAVALAANTCYWVEIANTPTGTGATGWFWETSAGGDGVALQHAAAIAGSNPYTGTDFIANDLAFCLDQVALGTASSCIPPTGACCTAGGANCQITTPLNCTQNLNGTYSGNNSVCFTDNGSAPVTINSAPNVAIPDADANGVTDTITVPANSGGVVDVNVRVNIPDHTFIGDLVITLTHNGHSRILWDTQCTNSQALVALFDDDQPSAVCAQSGAGGPFQPAVRGDGTFAILENQLADGTWDLNVVDTAAQDTGTLVDWDLIYTPGLATCNAVATGACCTAGNCAVTTQAGCGGTYQGNNSVCNPNPCAPVTGACCTGLACVISTSAACATSGGTYEGNASTCTVNICCTGHLLGDANCDNVVNNFDIDAFVAIVLDPSNPVAPPGYITAYAAGANPPGRPTAQGCWNVRGCIADLDHGANGGPHAINNFDIDPFVVCILAGASPCP